MMEEMQNRHRHVSSSDRAADGVLGPIAAAWGVAGMFLLLGSAVYRLSLPAMDAFSLPFRWYHWTAVPISLALLGYGEGYRGFQRGFSLRVAARARFLRDHPSTLRTLLAPLFCMGYFHASRRRKILAYLLTAVMIVLVFLVRRLPQPWHGIVDLGVLFGLLWGLVTIALFTRRAFSVPVFSHPAEVPGHTPPAP